jgi:arabinogalactan oligomer/maltooligosaccharide transport system permease protein
MIRFKMKSPALLAKRAALRHDPPTLNLRIRLFVTVLLAPALLVMLAVVAFPFLLNFVLSFSNANNYRISDWRMIGFAQYVSVLTQQLFWSILLKTVIWTVVSIFFHVAIGVLLAVVLHQKFIRGKSVWRIALVLPWALPQYISALTWRGMFNYEYGAVNLLLTKYLHLSPVQWLTSPFEAFLAVIITNIWLGFPFMMVIALGGLQSIPDELYEAAEVDGASKWFQFWHITAPLLRPLMIPAITLGMVWTFNNINVVWLVSNMGEPADSTHTLVSYVYKTAFNMYRFGWAAALSIVIFAILFLFSQVFLRRTQATEPVY